jgi:hypothetical protein
MRHCIFLSFILLLSCSDQKQNLVRNSYFDSIHQNNIKLLDSLHLTQFNDTAKWLLYTVHCLDSTLYGRARERELLDKVPLAFLDISLNYIQIENDTLYLLYNFLYNDSVIIEQTTNLKPVTNGIAFDIKNRTVIGYIKGEAIVWGMGIGSHYENTLQPNVISFINKNLEELNPWFRKEVIRRKILDFSG